MGESMEDLLTFFRKDNFAAHNGIEVVEVGKGTATVRMDIGPMHLNSHGTVHGGALFSLADTAFALASNSHGVPAAAINAHISYMKSARSGILYARAEEFALNPKLATYSVYITDQEENRIAIFQGMVYRKSSRP
jgi:acyl-CoA thioesterase